MSDRTGIEWTDATWNPVRGCSRVSEGCRHCYAEGQAARIIAMDRGRGVLDGDGSYDGLLAKGGQWNGQIKLVPENLKQPLRWSKPRMIFVNSMSDLFHENLSFEYVAAVFNVMEQTPWHTYQILTKRPARMADFFRQGEYRWGQYPLKNVWLGVSVENQTAADERIPLLLEVPAAVRWASAEPLLGPISLANATGIDWLVVGGESGPKARPMHPEWATSLRDQCRELGAAFFFKQWGEWAPNCLCCSRQPHMTIARPEPGKPGVMFRCGKRRAGRMLDGRTWNEQPGDEQ